MEASIAGLRGEVEASIAGLRGEVEASIARLGARTQRFMFGMALGIVGLNVTLTFGLLKFFFYPPPQTGGSRIAGRVIGNGRLASRRFIPLPFGGGHVAFRGYLKRKRPLWLS